MLSVQSMKCAFIITPGETIEGRDELRDLGYSICEYPSTQDDRALTDTRCGEFVPFIGTGATGTESLFARSLRASFVRMLRDPQFDDDDYIIFGESDSTPVLSSERVRACVEKAIVDNPGVDVFRLHHSNATVKPKEPYGELTFEVFQNKRDHTVGTSYAFGTHALVIPRKSREKIASIFESYQMPIDTALECSCWKGEAQMMVTNYNAFWQKERSVAPDRSSLYRHDQLKMALMLSSYKRLSDLQRQIYCMLDQSYQNFHLFVAVKGIATHIFKLILLPQFKKYIDSGKLTLRWCPNKNQMSNLLDTIRGKDIDDYDLFVKIDDDDFYSVDYLKTVNDFHNTIPKHHSSLSVGVNWCIGKGEHVEFDGMKRKDYQIFGATSCMKRPIINALINYERDPSVLPTRFASLRDAGCEGIGFAEDHVIFHLMQHSGYSNIYSFAPTFYHCIPNLTNASVTRGGLFSDKFALKNLNVNTDVMNYEYTVGIASTEWVDTVIILGAKCTRSRVDDVGEVLMTSPEKIVISWEPGVEELYEFDDAYGCYNITGIRTAH